ncbi:MAG: potassium channel family protein [Candidatus Dadabacteria bacterium]|nr:potassium channel family protein [Candidatus Dadabacteria bacterium]
MRNLIERPLYILLLYMGGILLFALIYWILPHGSFGKNLSLIESIYLSVVTITTLGYGDITPTNGLGMAITMFESIFGIVIIGAFINSAWKSHTNKIEQEQSRKIQETLKEKNRNNLLSYVSYSKSLIDDYQLVNFEITTPMSERSGKEPVLNFEFQLSDMRDIFYPSLSRNRGFGDSLISAYFDTEKAIISELKYILTNFDFEDFPKLKELIILFLTASHKTDVEKALIYYDNLPSDHQMRKLLVSMIRESKEQRTIGNQPNIIDPVVALNEAIPVKMRLINAIILEFENIQSNNTNM